ncbi:Retrovirus-related Pol polyprotein from transposon [Apostichopus japonicus]|uniref:Retrovirus-related Pol polyprotein from transposon n=2 Tax=Stichopus japonicus TaxID=307972 RepID=A0A2G8L5T4_STIJA|nr:Retrovirus-related Pol polyprotein from transposon [Apostichopus japonicus]
MLKRGVIEPSSSPWASPVVLVKKKDGSTRFCVDYRRLNDITTKDSYPIPRIDDSLDSLNGSTWFTTLDLASGYWQVEMDESDREKTAFITHSGLYQFCVMPFGLCNAPATFERLMEKILSGLQWQTCLVYLDDVIIFGKNFEEHIAAIDDVFTRFKLAGLKLSPKKCFLFKQKVEFLGHVVSKDGVSTDPSKVAVVKNWPRPNCVRDVRGFVGLCSYYRKFVKNFTLIARPLHRLTEKGKRFLWNEECEEAFNALKVALTSTPILAFPTPSDKYILDTDASNESLGSVLSQIQGGEERVIAYFSKSFSKAERRYCVTRKELYAIVASIKHFHHYLYGAEFLVRTDHGALRWLLNFKQPEGQIARWLEMLGTYNYEIQHRPGSKHGNADALSRRPCVDVGIASV